MCTIVSGEEWSSGAFSLELFCTADRWVFAPFSVKYFDLHWCIVQSQLKASSNWMLHDYSKEPGGIRIFKLANSLVQKSITCVSCSPLQCFGSPAQVSFQKFKVWTCIRKSMNAYGDTEKASSWTSFLSSSVSVNKWDITLWFCVRVDLLASFDLNCGW